MGYVDRTSLSFDSTGKLTAITDRFGKSLTLAWGTGSATATDPTGRHTTITITSGKITTVTDSANRAWTFAYTGSNLTGINDPATNHTTFGYNASNQLTTVSRTLNATNPNGTKTPATPVWTFGYTGARATSVTDPTQAANGIQTGFAYGATSALGTTTVTSPGDTNTGTPTLTTAYNLNPNARGFVDSLVRSWTLADVAASYTTNFGYDPDGNVLSISRQRDATHYSTTSYTYYDSGNVHTKTEPLTATTTRTTTYVYDIDNDLQTETVAGTSPGDPISITTAYAYDAAGHMCRRVQNPTVAPSTITCTSTLPPSSPDSNISTGFTYEGHDLLIAGTDQAGVVTRYGYDSVGNRTSIIANYVSGGPTNDTTNLTTTYTYDAAGNVLTETDPITNITTPVVTATTTFTYDPMGDVLTKTVPGDAWVPSSETVYAYDEYGNETTNATCAPSAASAAACTTAAINKSITTRDVLGRGVTLTDITVANSDKAATTTTSATAYDDAGYVFTTTSTDGIVNTRAYDGVGRVVSEATAGATTTHAYDGLGDEITTVSPASNTTMVTTTRTFNPSGTVLTSTTDAAGTITYLYDSIGRQIGSVDAAGLSMSSTHYDDLGRVLSATTTNKITDIQTGGTTYVTTTVDTTYDQIGRVLTATEPYKAGETPVVTAVTYDALGRSTSTTSNYVPGSSDPDANITTRSYYDAAGDATATSDSSTAHIVTRSVFSVGGKLVETIDNCTDAGTTPSSAPAACIGAGTHDASTNMIARTAIAVSAGELVTTNTVGGITTTTTTDGEGRVIKSVIDPATGGVRYETDYAYDTKGRLFAQATPAPTGTGKIVSITLYDPGTGRVSNTIDNCTDLTPPSVWSACTGTGPNDGTQNLETAYVYDTAGNVTSMTSPSGAITTYTYDAVGHQTSVTADGATTRYYYDAAGRTIAVATPNQLGSYTVNRYAFDAAGHNTATLANCTDSGTTAPATDAAIVACAGHGTVNATTNILTVNRYDASGELVAKTEPSPADAGTGASRVTTEYAYDVDHRLCRVLENAQSGIDLAALADPCVTAVAGTSTTNVSTTYAYDTAGRLLTSTQAADPASNQAFAVTTYGYDGADNVISVRDPDGFTTTFTYDLLGHKTSETDPDTTAGSTTAWLYDTAGRSCRRVVAAVGGALPNLTTLAHPCTDAIAAAAIDTRYAYDLAGNLASATDAISGQTVAATYDPLARPLRVTNTGGVIGSNDPGTTYAYTSLQTATRTDPSAAYNFTFDGFGRQVAMDNPLSGGAGDDYAWTYGPSGVLTSQTTPTGSTGTTHLVATYGYDALGRLAAKTTVKHVNGSNDVTLASYAYTLNAAGSELSATSTITGDPTNGLRSYSYDPLGRLGSATMPTQAVATYGWNATPDRASVQRGTAPAITTYFTAANRPISDSAGSSYSSDKEGRLTAAPGQRYKWDNLGRLTEVDSVPSGAVVATYKYDPLDRLVKEQAGTLTTTYLHVGLTDTIAQVQVSNGTTTTKTSHLTDAGGAEIATFDAVTRIPTYLGANSHGDVTWGADASGTVVSTAAYDPFGVTVATTGTPGADRWQGSLFDTASGLYYVVARWYSPSLGRFISVDSVAGSPADPQSLDRYSYVMGNPLGGVDPFGTCNWDTVSMTCKADVAPTRAGPDGRALVAAAAARVAAMPRPVNPCLASNFHAAGCSGGAVWKADTKNSATCAKTGGHAGCGAMVSTASPELVQAAEQIRLEARAAVEAQKVVDRNTKEAADRAREQALAAIHDAFKPSGGFDIGGMIGSAATAATSFVENNASAVTHAALGVATFVPGIGSLAAVADAGLYTYEGDYTAAGLAMLAVVPGGVILGKAALIARTAAKVDKLVTVVNDANKIERLATDIGKVENVATDLNKIQKGVKNGFGSLTRAEEYGVQGYSSLRTGLKGTALQAHHLLEQRFAEALGQKASQMLSIAVTPAEHQVFTNEWRRLIGYGAGTKAATADSVGTAARQIYANHPEILAALGL